MIEVWAYIGVCAVILLAVWGIVAIIKSVCNLLDRIDELEYYKECHSTEIENGRTKLWDRYHDIEALKTSVAELQTWTQAHGAIHGFANKGK